MNKVKETVDNILNLRSVRERLQGEDLKRLDGVIRSLRSSLGETVSKSHAAELLGVSRQTLDRWIEEDVLPAVRLANGRQQVLSSALERLLFDLRDLREKGIDGKVLPRLRNLSKPEAAKKPAAKKPAAKKPAAKKPAAKKTAKKTAKKPAAKKTAKKPAAKKTAKKPAAKKTAKK